jgi:hypothetical protein
MKITKAAAGFAIAAAAAFAPAMLLTAPVASAEPCLATIGPDNAAASNSNNPACMACMQAHPDAQGCFPAPFVGGPASGNLGGALGVG